MTRASRTSEVPPTTVQVAAAVRATEAVRDGRTTCSATAPSPTAPPTHTAVCSVPHPRWSRHNTRSTAPAARPNAATGCPRRGSPSSRSPIRPAAAPYAKTRSARTGSAGRGVVQVPGTAGGSAGEHRVMSSLRVSTPWFDESGGESSWLPGLSTPVTVAGPRRIRTGFLFFRRILLRPSPLAPPETPTFFLPSAGGGGGNHHPPPPQAGRGGGDSQETAPPRP